MPKQTHHEHVLATMPEAGYLARHLLSEIERLGGGRDTLLMQAHLQELTRCMARHFDSHIRVLFPLTFGDHPWRCSCGATSDAVESLRT